MKRWITAAALALAAGAANAQTPPPGVELTSPGPQGPLAGTLLDPDGKGPALVLIPGSGPTDRDGNSPLGIAGASYRLLAEALAKRGVATLRIDKRGLFGSKAAVADPNAVRIPDYAADVHAWVDLLRARTGRSCIWLAGHSEGGLVALVAAQDPRGLCGVVLLSAAGRPAATKMREQFRANPANAPFLPAALAMLDALEAGRTVDPATLPAPLPALFPEAVQRYMIAWFAYDPAKLAANLHLPMLIVQGDHDLQVSPDDARVLSAAAPGATLAVLPGVTHMLKVATGETRAANMATYTDLTLPIAPGVVDAIARFVTAKR